MEINMQNKMQINMSNMQICKIKCQKKMQSKMQNMQNNMQGMLPENSMEFSIFTTICKYAKKIHHDLES
jgi:hypothetical protein